MAGTVINAYCQKVSVDGVEGYINFRLFQSNKNAADTINVFRKNIEAVYFSGLWSEFKGASIGDSCWHNSGSVLVLRENLILQIVLLLTGSSDSLYRPTIIDIAKKIMEKFTANAVCLDHDTVSEHCAASSIPSDASVWNFTGDTLQIDSIKVEVDTIKYPQCALMFSLYVEAPISFAFEHDTVKEHLFCYPSSVKCQIFDYNRIAPGSGVQKMKIRPFWTEPFFWFLIDTNLDTFSTDITAKYCSDSLATIQAKIVFYVGKYRASLLVTGWINSTATGVGSHGKSLLSPAKVRYSSRIFYDVLGRKIPPALMPNKNRPDIKKEVYLKSKPQ